VRTPGTLAAAALTVLAVLGCSPSEGPAVPPGGQQVACQGVPQTACQQAVDSIGGTRGAIARVVVRCTLPICTDATGEADVIIFFADGRQETRGYGWASAPAQPAPLITPPPLTVEPVCLGIPLQKCRDMAISGLEGTTADKVGKITVHCSAVCTPTSGTGQTTYEFVDGRPSVTVDWSYEGGG
jgi:hypothetical protein